MLSTQAGSRVHTGKATKLVCSEPHCSAIPGRRLFFALALLASVAFAQDPPSVTPLRVAAAGGPAELRLTGPSVAPVGSPVAIVVSGLPSVDLTQTIGEQTTWIESLRFDVSTPAGAQVELEKELSMSVSPWSWRLRLTIIPPGPGTYLVVCDWNQAPYGLAMHRIEVGTGPPVVVVPPIVPDPITPPKTSGVTFLVVVRENQSLTADQAAVLAKLRTWSDARQAKITHLEVSPDAGSEDSRLAGYVALAKTLPWLVISRQRTDGSGAAVLWDGALPGTLDEITSKVAEVVR